MELKICNKCHKETCDYIFIYNEFSDDTLYICKACDIERHKQLKYCEINFKKSCRKNSKANRLQYEVDRLTSENEGLKEENKRLRIELENVKNN